MANSIIAVVGGVTMDLIFGTPRMPELGESLDASSLVHKPGGKGSNVCVAIYRAQHNKPTFGSDRKPIDDSATSIKIEFENATTSKEFEQHEVKVYLNPAIGDDTFGKQLKINLQDNGVDVTGIKVLPDQMTGTCAVFVEETGKSRDIGYPGANTHWMPKDQDSVECLAGGQKPDLVICQLEIKKETIMKVLETAASNGVDTLLNPSPVASLPSTTYNHVTHLVLNEPEAAELSGVDVNDLGHLVGWKKTAKIFLDRGVKNLILTLGAEGALFATKDSEGYVPGVASKKAKESTGAGDTFTGVYALEVVRQKQRGEWDIRKAVELACKAAARTVEQVGAQESIPWKDEIHSCRRA